MINYDLHMHLLTSYDRGRRNWSRKRLERRFGKNAVDEVIDLEHLVYHTTGRVSLAFLTGGTVDYELFKQLSSEHPWQALGLIEYLDHTGRLLPVLKFIESFVNRTPVEVELSDKVWAEVEKRASALEQTAA